MIGAGLFRLLSGRAGAASALAAWAPVPIRLIVGGGFIEHGVAKAERGWDAFPAILAALGVPAPHLLGAATIAVEIGGGAAVLLGALVPLASIPMTVVLLTAMATVHWPYGFSSIKLLGVSPEGPRFGPPGVETDLLYLAGLAALVLGGAGPFSVDRFFSRRALPGDGLADRASKSSSDAARLGSAPVRAGQNTAMPS